VSHETIVGRRVGEVSRRGKYLWLALDRGGLLMHLGMSGSLSFGTATAEPGPHDHFDLVTARGTLRLTDPRRFGAVVWSAAADAAPAATLLAGLGLEPFDDRFDGAHLYAALRRRRVAVKTALLGGEIVVGAGNI
jgi:formamidopyrimidine-DNA glycosylase